MKAGNLTRAGSSASSPPVSRANKLIALLLVALWLPATLHCQLESLGLEAIFACADHPAETAHASGDGCTDQGCLTIESGQFALTKSQLDLSCPPALADGGLACLPALSPPVPAPEISAAGQDETLRLRRTWQFARRAALPARAPDTLNV